MLEGEKEEKKEERERKEKRINLSIQLFSSYLQPFT